MNTLAGLLVEKPLEVEAPPLAGTAERGCEEAAPPTHSVRDEQIQALIQQLFLQLESDPVKHVGFAAIEPQAETALLCLEVATALAESGPYDVGLIDAGLQSAPLHTRLQIPAGRSSETEWQIAPRLWLVPRHSWLNDGGHKVWDPTLTRLRKVTAEYDFSVLFLDPVSWVTARMSQTCDGIVMVLTASKTRRLVAAQIQAQLERARVPILGTVLAERRFPVPKGLYRNL